MGKMPTNSLGKSSELKLQCFCLIDAYSMPKDICSVPVVYLLQPIQPVAIQATSPYTLYISLGML